MYTGNSNRFTRVTKQNPCPICGKPDNCNIVIETGDVYCRRVESDRPGRDGGYLHRINDRDIRMHYVPLAPPNEVKREPAAPDILDRVYRRLLAASPLTDADRAHLAARGLTDEQIERHGYRSLTANKADRELMAAIMLEDESPDVVGHVPGIYRKDGRLTVAGKSVLMIPVMQNGRIVGIRFRDPNAQGNDRYTWLSTGDLPDGCSSGAPAHVAMPTGCNDTSIVIVTEGEIKANITADKTGRPVIAVPGVTITKDVIPLLAQLGAGSVWMAFDGDTATKPQVAQAEHKLIEGVIAQGYEVHRLSWPSAWKGIDDALTANIIPVAVAVSRVENGKELDRLKRQLQEEREHTAKVFAAINSNKNGPEAKTAVNIVHDMKERRVPVGEWTPLTNERIARIDGISTRRVSDRKKAIEKHYGNVIEFDVRQIPASVNTETGEYRPPHELTFARLKANPAAVLDAIAGNVPEVPKNGNGGNHPKKPACPTCGPDASVLIESRFRCGDCNAVIATNPPRVFARSRREDRQTVPPLTMNGDTTEVFVAGPPEMFPLTTTLSTVDRLSPLSRSSSSELDRLKTKLSKPVASSWVNVQPLSTHPAEDIGVPF